MFLVVCDQTAQLVKATFYPDLRVSTSISRTAGRGSPLDRYGWIFSSHLFKTRSVKLQGRCRERTHRCRSRDEDPLLDDTKPHGPIISHFSHQIETKKSSSVQEYNAKLCAWVLTEV